MEQKDLLRNILIAAGIFLLIMAIGPRLLPPPPPPASPDEILPADTAASVPGPSIPQDDSLQPASPPQQGFRAVEHSTEESITLGDESPDSAYRMRLSVSNVGASIESALLSDHAARIKQPERYALLSPVVGAGGQTIRSLAVEKVNIDGQDLSLHDKKWIPDHPVAADSGQKAQFYIDIQDANGAAALRLTRVFHLPAQPRAESRHDLSASLTVENLGTGPRRIVVTTRGAVGIPQDSSSDHRVVDYGVVTPSGHVIGARTPLATIAQKGTAPLFAWSSADPGTRLSWAASANTYFTCTIAPVDADGSSVAAYVTELAGIDIDASPTSASDATVRFTSASVEVSPGAKVHYPAAVYLGEKDGKAFRAVSDYAARNYYYQIEQGFGWCTFTFLVELMIWLLNGLNFIFRDYGVAIIILVLIVRALLHPITKKGQVNMVRMQHKMSELAPKIEEIKKKYANDRARMNQEMMKLDINPAGQILTCLPMFLQMPIWVALYLSLSNNILMRHEPFLYGLTWIDDLTAQDALIKFSSPIYIPLFGWELTSFNLVPLLVGLFMYIQQKTQPKPKPNPNMTDQQRQQMETMQRMMPIMSIMMILIFYKFPSGLNLYVMFSSLFGWLEQRVIRKHIREQEDAGTLHKPARRPREDFPDKPRELRKPGWLERLQKAAEEAQKAQKLPKGKKR